MSESRETDADKMPTDEQLQEPSAEKEPGEEPKEVDAGPDDVDHRAVGIGIVDDPVPGAVPPTEQVSPPHPTAAETATADAAAPTDAVSDDVKSDAADPEGPDGSTS